MKRGILILVCVLAFLAVNSLTVSKSVQKSITPVENKISRVAADLERITTELETLVSQRERSQRSHRDHLRRLAQRARGE